MGGGRIGRIFQWRQGLSLRGGVEEFGFGKSVVEFLRSLL